MKIEHVRQTDTIMLDNNGHGSPFGWEAAVSEGRIYAFACGRTAEDAKESAGLELKLFKRRNQGESHEVP